jgi:cytochrome c peroxidase
VYANDDVPLAQAAIRELLCEQPEPATQGCEPAAVLPRTIALFKTPGLRDLGQSGPYLHTGQKDTLGDVLTFHARLADDTRAGRVRNPDPQLAGIALAPADVDPLTAFLESLNEDYE